MLILCILGFNKKYSLIKLKHKKIQNKQIADNSNFFLIYQELLVNEKPDEIYVLTGPDSFTGSRFCVLSAKILSLMYDIPIKSCSLINCIQIAYKQYIDAGLVLILNTGTSKFFVYCYRSNKIQLLFKEELDFSTYWTTNHADLINDNDIDKTFFLKWPTEIDRYMIEFCETQNIDADCKPYYTLKPAYLDTEEEI